MKKYIIFIPVIILLIIQYIDKDGEYKILQYILLVLTVIYVVIALYKRRKS